MDTNKHESENQPFPFQLWVLEIQDDSNPQFCDFQIVQHLSAFRVSDSINDFRINDDTIKSDQVRNENPDFIAFVMDIINDLLLACCLVWLCYLLEKRRNQEHDWQAEMLLRDVRT